MAVFILRKVLKSQLANQMMTVSRYSQFADLYTPDYLELMKPKIPLYPTINIQVKGYNFPVLEQFQKLVHQLAENMDIDVENSYALPGKSLKIKKYKLGSSVLDAEYKLEIYERNIQISHMSTPKLPILIRMMEAALPEGVTMTVDEWTFEKDELRYVPDKELMDLKVELEGMQRKKS
ncbi:hypothetical protein HCN44_001862 [Aphidius gifuensis]|uniref:Small ribosomal subunit protein uS10 domain-containing protein n=1 Tax=Aphidius gifuensis TaxID=684658 RepID=A0A835CX72_APHGI|nr:39S ribosomal protein L48, mitochondrial [Aphidius gifuensis]KAF7996230.1 hypothetical protein HCN44_001862 [Aphidius gifuensis]